MSQPLRAVIFVVVKPQFYFVSGVPAQLKFVYDNGIGRLGGTRDSGLGTINLCIYNLNVRLPDLGVKTRRTSGIPDSESKFRHASPGQWTICDHLRIRYFSDLNRLANLLSLINHHQ